MRIMKNAKSEWLLDRRFFRAGLAKKDSPAQCEVVAVAPQKDSYILSKDYKEFNPILQKLSDAKELSTGAGSYCLVRFAAIKNGSHLMSIGTGSDGMGVNQLGAVERIRRLGGAVANALASEKI